MGMRVRKRTGALVVIGLLVGAWGFGQDARVVREPVVPTACTTLAARLMLQGGALAAEDESRLDTLRIQGALDTCGRGRAVVLRADGTKQVFLSGPLELRDGVTLVVARGAELLASRDPAVYAERPGSCGVVSAADAGQGCRPLIGARGVRGAGVMGEGVMAGGGGATLLGQTVTWWQLAEQARSGGRQQVPRLIVADHADDFTVYGITLKNSPNFHVVYDHGEGFTAWGVRIDTPKRGARNTDGIDPGDGAKDITITHSSIRTGDDDVAIKGGAGGATQITVSDDHFYWGHGISIGSETNGGVSKVRIENVSLDGPDNGIRIKSNGSRGGLVEDVVYSDVCIRNAANPIVFDPGYTAAGTPQGSSPPTFHAITLRDVQVMGGGKFTFDGYDAVHDLQVRLDGVVETDDAPASYSIKFAHLVLGPGPVTALKMKLLRGEDSTINLIQSTPTEMKASVAAVPSCAAMLVPFPAQ
jgi:polygalacturonase